MEEFSPRIIEDGGTIPARLNAVQEAAVKATLEGVVRALGVVDGTVKGDLVVEGDQVCVLEVALRLSGGWFASDQIRLACGVDLVTASISQAMGERVAVSDLTPSLNRATAIRYWFPEPGRIVEITGRAEVLDSPGVERVDIAFGVGDTLPAVRSHRDRFGSVVCSGEGRDKAIENVARALKCLTVRTEHEDDA